MKGFPKVLKTKEDYYNCLAMVASGELAAADLLAKIESAENQRYIECGVAAVEEEKKAVICFFLIISILHSRQVRSKFSVKI